MFAVESDVGFEWYLVIDLCKGGTLYNYLQKKSAKPKDKLEENEKEKKPEDDDFLGLGGLVAAIAGETEEESDIEEGEFYGIAEEDAKNVVTQVMSCLNYLHKNRLVHAGECSFCVYSCSHLFSYPSASNMRSYKYHYLIGRS